MARLYNLARVTTATTGTGTITLGSAVSGFLTFANAGAVDGETISYAINDGANSEVGYGVYTTSGTTLTRNVITSTNSNSAINLSGTAQIVITANSRDVGKWTNRRVAKTAAYTITTAEDGSTVAMAGAAFYALTIPNPTGFPSDFTCQLLNEDTGRAKLLLPVYTTSSTSLAIGTGSKAFTVSAGLYFSTASVQRFRAYSLANNANFVSGTGSYSGTTFTMTVDVVGGSGTITDWQIAPEIYLWPSQTAKMFNQNNVWRFDPADLTWAPDGGTIQLNIDPTNGKDYNDGLGTTTGATKTIQRAVNLAAAYFKNGKNVVGGYYVVLDGASNTFQEQVQAYYKMERSPGFIARNMTWKPANSGYCLQTGDGAYFAMGTGVTLDGNGTTTPIGYIFGHGDGIVDTTEAVINLTTGGLSGSMFESDGPFRWNILNGVTITNSGGRSSGFVFKGVPGSSWNINGAFTFSGTPSVGRFAWVRQCDMNFQGNVTFTGAHSIGQTFINQNGILINQSGATLPGGTPTLGGGTLLSGGQYVTAVNV